MSVSVNRPRFDVSLSRSRTGSPVARKPGPTSGLRDICIEVTSAVPSPVPPSPPIVLLSRPWPHSWWMTSAISPVLLQPPPERKKLTEVPLKKALQVLSRFVFAVNDSSASHGRLGSHLCASRRICVR